MKTKDVTGKMGKNTESLISTCLSRKLARFVELMNYFNKKFFFLRRVGVKINKYHILAGLVEQTIN